MIYCASLFNCNNYLFQSILSAFVTSNNRHSQSWSSTAVRPLSNDMQHFTTACRRNALSSYTLSESSIKLELGYAFFLLKYRATRPSSNLYTWRVCFMILNKQRYILEKVVLTMLLVNFIKINFIGVNIFTPITTNFLAHLCTVKKN